MHVMQLDEAPEYQAPGHIHMSMRRLQGKEAGLSDAVWIGLSTIEPGGGTTVSAAHVEKFYVVVEGALEITARVGDEPPQSAVLRLLDSCRLAPGETRRLQNRSNLPCKVLLVMPN
jgi:uncharacterized cupin superfamily protein